MRKVLSLSVLFALLGGGVAMADNRREPARFEHRAEAREGRREVRRDERREVRREDRRDERRDVRRDERATWDRPGWGNPPRGRW